MLRPPRLASSQVASSHGAFLCRVRAYGPGIEPTGPIVGAPANFTVETFSAGKGNVDVTVDDSKGNKLPVKITSLLSIVKSISNMYNIKYSNAYSFRTLITEIMKMVIIIKKLIIIYFNNIHETLFNLCQDVLAISLRKKNNV